MSADNLMPEANEDLTQHEEKLLQGYEAPGPSPEFVASLGSRLADELAPPPEIEPLDRSNRIIAVALAVLALSVLVMAGGVGVGVWYLMSRSVEDPFTGGTTAPQPTARFVQTDSSADSDQPDPAVPNALSGEPSGNGTVANNGPPDERGPEEPLVVGEEPVKRPGTPVAEGLTGRPRVDEQANQDKPGSEATAPRKIATVRYGWQAGKTYAYDFSLESKTNEGKSTSTGRVSYQVVSPAGVGRATLPAEHATGSGFVVTEDGHLVSCAHVVRGATQIDVKFGHDTYEAEVIALDKRNDLALLKIDVTGWSALSLGDSAAVELAQDVRVVGYPLTDVLGSSIKVTRGTISGFVEQEADRLFQVDAPINAGNSGGPVVNQRGHVVGVASAKLSGAEISNVGFAVPVAKVGAFLQRHGVNYEDGRRGVELPGPVLARRITPAVALLEVTIGAGGVGLEQQVQLDYSASMTTREPMSSRAGHFDPFSRRIGPRGLGSFPVTRKERGKLRVDVIGETYDSEFNLDLPFLFGPAALLAIDPLGEEGETSWYRQRTISLVRTKEEQQPSSPFGPRMHRPPFFPDPFAPRQEPRKKVVGVTSAFERYDYELGEVTSDTITVKKKYNLKTLEEDADPKITMTGDGVIVFDRAEGVPKSSIFKATFEVESNNVKSTIPVTLTYSAIDPAPAVPEPAAVAKQPPTQTAPVEQALRPGQIDDVLTRLTSGDRKDIQKVLGELLLATPGERRVEIAQAIEPHLKHKHWPIRQAAARALAKWAVEQNTAALIAVLQDSDFAVRREAVKALGLLPSREAADAIVSIYGKSAREAKAALLAIGPVAEDAALSLLQDAHRVHRADACEILGEIGSAKSLDVLREVDSRAARDAITSIESRVTEELGAVEAIDRQYRGPGAVPATGRAVTSDSPLFIGQIVLAVDAKEWYPADVLQLLPDGRVKIHFRGWSDKWDTIVERASLQLGPDNLTQPEPAASTPTVSPQSNRLPTSARPTGALLAPEEVLRAFLLALVQGDRETATALVVAGTDDDTLWKASPLGAAALSRKLQAVKSLQLRVLSVGETVDLPSGRKLTLTERHINTRRTSISYPGNGVPFILVNTAAGWRVDARTIVAARRAAERARAKK